jgi:nucleolar MIF4G domain-containing protein 1
MPILQHYGRPLRSRVDVTTILTTTIISSIADHASLLDHHVVLHAALVAALYRTVGVDFGPYMKAIVYSRSLNTFAAAYCVQEAVSSYLSYYRATQSPDWLQDEEIKGKECTNLMVLLCELYNFQVIACVLMYDMIRVLLGSVVSEMDVEILLKILRSMCRCSLFSSQF